MTEESVKHVYFEIILKLHYDWFTAKIYDCFEMLFMRLNEDGKLVTYENVGSGNSNSNANNNNSSNNNNANNNSNPVYHLHQT